MFCGKFCEYDVSIDYKEDEKMRRKEGATRRLFTRLLFFFSYILLIFFSYIRKPYNRYSLIKNLSGMDKISYLISVFLLLLAAGCKDDSDDMQKYLQPFLGQWQEIACGNDDNPELTSDGHVIEFLSNGTFIRGTGTGTCRADAEFLYYDSGTPPDGYTWRYTFTGTNSFLLDMVDGLVNYDYPSSTPTFHLYKRIKTNEP
jgi:hypothetical protein